tara:strand:+ start:2379 stop:3296 length:918 start_codon:yes stop_codon:yes gene_type:complete
MKKINQIITPFLHVPASGGVRTIRILGESGASFDVELFDGSGNYYDFTDKTWGVKETKSIGNVLEDNFNLDVTFAAGGDESYTAIFYVYSDTQFSKELSEVPVYTLKMKRIADTTVTIDLVSVTNTANYVALPTETYTAPPLTTGLTHISKAFSWNLVAVAGSFTAPGRWRTSSLKNIFTTTASKAASGNVVQVVSTQGIGIGDTVSGTPIVGTPKVTAIDELSLAVTLDADQIIAATDTLLFTSQDSWKALEAQGGTVAIESYDYNISVADPALCTVRVVLACSSIGETDYTMTLDIDELLTIA